jgi:hypothetical protein
VVRILRLSNDWTLESCVTPHDLSSSVDQQ